VIEYLLEVKQMWHRAWRCALRSMFRFEKTLHCFLYFVRFCSFWSL